MAETETVSLRQHFERLLDENGKYFERLLNERDKQYGERAGASEKAIVKAEDAQKSYNQSHNDLARKMDEQNKATMPRTETETRFRNLEEKINELRIGTTLSGGVLQGGQSAKDDSRQSIGTWIAIGGLLLTLAVAFAKVILK